MKAKSRLKSAVPESSSPSSHSDSVSVTPRSTTSDSLPQIPQTFSSHHFQHTTTGIQLGKLKGLSKYLRHLPTLLLSLPFYMGVVLILQKVPPQNLKNFLIPNLYLPFQIALFLGNFFLFSFLCLNSRRGFLLSLLIQTLVFFKLQSVVFNLPLVIGTLGVFVIIEILFLIVNKVKNHEPKPGHKHRLPPSSRNSGRATQLHT